MAVKRVFASTTICALDTIPSFLTIPRHGSPTVHCSSQYPLAESYRRSVC